MQTKPSTETIRAEFEKMIASAETSEQADNRRLLMEYFTNPEFKRALEDAVGAINNG